ncbi:MAG: hypothetical protein CMM59_23300 [Rhodospirillaceae bacterium]|nr:hypothetical protein [Rhodospirillaceae bacterium]
MTSSIRRDPKNPDPRDVDLLKAISDAIVVSFNPEKASAEFAAEVTQMVREKYNKRLEEERAAGGAGD